MAAIHLVPPSATGIIAIITRIALGQNGSVTSTAAEVSLHKHSAAGVTPPSQLTTQEFEAGSPTDLYHGYPNTGWGTEPATSGEPLVNVATNILTGYERIWRPGDPDAPVLVGNVALIGYALRIVLPASALTWVAEIDWIERG